MPRLKTARILHSSCSFQDFVYVFCGYNLESNELTNSVERIQIPQDKTIFEDSWITVDLRVAQPALTTSFSSFFKKPQENKAVFEAMSHCISYARDDRIVIFGGKQLDKELETVYTLDPISNQLDIVQDAKIKVTDR